MVESHRTVADRTCAGSGQLGVNPSGEFVFTQTVLRQVRHGSAGHGYGFGIRQEVNRPDGSAGPWCA